MKDICLNIKKRRFVVLVLSAVCSICMAAPSHAADKISVSPENIKLQGAFDQVQLLVTKNNTTDLTSQASYTSSNQEIVTVEKNGRLLAKGNGSAKISVKANGQTISVPITVSQVDPEPQIDFDLQVRPVLSRLRCNMGGCHSAQHGQAGFKLTVFGFDPAADHANITRNEAQRRINFLQPEKSLFLVKPTMQVPHGGGKRLEAGSLAHQLLVAWVRSGANGTNPKSPKLTKIIVSPEQRLTSVGQKQQLRVVAHYDNDTQKDVTSWTQFDSMDDSIIQVDESGLVEVVNKGQTSIMARYEEQANIATFVVPYASSIELKGWKNNNYIDELAEKKFRELGIEPSPICDDATFLRRAFLDSIGTLPPSELTKEFLASQDPKKREKLVDRLLGLTGDPKLDTFNDQYAAFWTLKWSDLIRNQSASVGEQGMWSLHNWIKDSFRTNKPFDQFVYELVTAKGSIYSSGPANFFRINKNSSDLAEATSQLFLGVRLTCAKCHHHPFQKYGQDDYYKFAAFFARVGTKNSEEFGLFGRESVVVVRTTGEVRHLRTGKNMKPAPLEGEDVDHDLDRRIPLATWLTSTNNDYFAKSVVNRYVSYFLGRGLVEPVDDMRQTNPPSNVALMDALARSFADEHFNLKKLIRSIMVSRLYQLSSTPTEQNKRDYKFYSHYKVKRISAEALLDAIDASTNVQTKFTSLPIGTRAIELPDSNYPNYFLKTFGKPKRASVCECERMPDENLSQALHTLNGDIVTSKISNAKSRLAQLIKAKAKHQEIMNEIYLSALSRYPTQQEMELSQKYLKAGSSPKTVYEDLQWAILNSKHFLFVR